MAGQRTGLTGRGAPALVAGAFAGVAAFVLVVAVIAVLLGSSEQGCPYTGQPAGAVKGVPRRLGPIFVAAATQYRLGGQGPSILAAINDVETEFGRNLSTSSAGAIGWMQFMPATWARYGDDANHDGRTDPHDPWDAIFAAAHYLRANGAPGDWRTAIFAYNHADWYVDQVLAKSRRYRDLAQAAPQDEDEPAPVRSVPLATPGIGDGVLAGGGPVTVGASRFGDAHNRDDNGVGYRGDNLHARRAYAELGYTASTNETNAHTGLLGNLPYGTALQITYRGHSAVAQKLDVGRGGDPVDGHRRRIDLGYRVADHLHFHGTGVVTLQLPAGARLPAAGAQEDCPGMTAGLAGEGDPRAQALLHNPRITFLHPHEESDLRSGRVSPRLIALLSLIAERHRIALFALQSDHRAGTTTRPAAPPTSPESTARPATPTPTPGPAAATRSRASCSPCAAASSPPSSSTGGSPTPARPPTDPPSWPSTKTTSTPATTAPRPTPLPPGTPPCSKAALTGSSG
jgi:Transglycosylase SLT domain